MSLPNIKKGSTSHPPWYIYESQLSTVVEGVPLWTPGPYKEVDGSWNPIRLADVGYMMKGRFMKLFNAAEVTPSAPDGCGPFPQEKLRDPVFNARTVDRFATSSVEPCITNIDTETDPGNVQISVNLSNRCNQGAAMVLLGPAGAAKMESFDLRHPRFYADYCFRHCESWLQVAHAADEDVQIKNLIFVTGLDMVDAWALFAFPSSSDVCSVEFTTRGTAIFAARKDYKPSNSLNCPPILNFGPIDRQIPRSMDQCVVIRRFKLHRRIDKLRWQMSNGLRKAVLKRTEVLDAKTMEGDPDDAEVEAAEDDIETSEIDDKKPRRPKRNRNKTSSGSVIEENYLYTNRRGDGGAGGAGSNGKDAGSSSGLPPGNGGGRRDTGSGSSASDGTNENRSHVSRHASKDDGTASPVDSDVGARPDSPTTEFDNYFESDESVNSERVEPLDTLLEYILEACPSASYAGAGDHDVENYQSMIYDWDSFPDRLRMMKPEVHLQSNGLALLKDSIYSTTLVLPESSQAELDKISTSSISQLIAKISKLIKKAKKTTFASELLSTSSELTKEQKSATSAQATSSALMEWPQILGKGLAVVGWVPALMEREHGAQLNTTHSCRTCTEADCDTETPNPSELCKKCREEGMPCCPTTTTQRDDLSSSSSSLQPPIPSSSKSLLDCTHLLSSPLPPSYGVSQQESGQERHLAKDVTEDDEYDDDDYQSDASVTTIDTDVIRDYFTSRHGRIYSNSPYPLPVDEIEMQRLREEHEGFRLLMNGFIFFGPVNQVLANDQERRKRVLDLCTGQGVWVEQMAVLYPHVKFYGVDMVPLASRYPPENSQFEVHDVNTTLRWRDRYMDMVHIRNALLGISDYPRLLREVARVLRPGGLFLSREWAFGIYMVDGSSVADAAPGAHAFYECITAVLRQRGIYWLGHQIPGYLHHSGRFTQINPQAQQIMLGDVVGDQGANDLGIQFRNLTLQWGHAMRGMLLDSGRSAANVDALLGGFSQDIQHVQGLKVVSYIVHARRNNFM